MWHFPDEMCWNGRSSFLDASRVGDIQYYAGRRLPKVDGVVTVHFVQHHEPKAEVKVRTGRGKVILYEPRDDFPSDELLAKVMLVAG
jgi:hypothetical protein